MPQDSLIDRISQLVRIQSTADRPRDLQRAIHTLEVRLAKNNAITVELFERNGKPSLLAYCGPKRPERFQLILNGHVDVVTGQDSQFKPVVTNNKLYGRGALDMKATALVMTEVFMKTATRLPYPLGLQIVSDEEVGGAHGTKYQIEQGVTADFVIAGECTPVATICNQSRGLCWARLTFSGTSAHSAYPWDGSNAVVRASDYIRRLLAQYPVPTHKEWLTTVNVASFGAPNVEYNRVPDAATVTIDIRYVPGDTNFINMTTALRFLQSLDSDVTVTIENFGSCHFTDPQEPYTQQLTQAIYVTQRQSATFIQKHGAADVRYYSEAGIPAVTFGLQGSGPHSDDEYLDLSSIETYAQTLQYFVEHATAPNSK